jgi:hypothetical protein
MTLLNIRLLTWRKWADMLPIGLGSRIRVQSKGQGWNQGKGEDGGE